ncbi:DUF58 domain-containing protein [Kallotenue papyrolyticum]|uniref:DUF58 domain-containing protein n=1 Tax=Kallotenue papyrolyticum TaxID=1325125 RepID=UPI000478565F|nr:DUF58 domain-containing protein [Kallotenue papyrolyticum]
MKALGILLLAVLCFIAAQGTSIPLFLILCYLLLALLALAYLWAWGNLRGIRVSRQVGTQRAQVGEEIRERIVLENTWPLPKLWVELQDHSDLPLHSSGFVAYLPGHERRRWTLRTPCTMRGKWRLGPLTLHSGDPFGIFRLQTTSDETAEVLVYPATVALPNLQLPGMELQGGTDLRTRTFHVTPNVSTIREYVPGDSFNRIHWRTTARTGRLMVKEFELDPTADIWIVADMHERSQAISDQRRTLLVDRRLGREIEVPESTEEYIVSAAASIARHLLDGSRSVGLLAWGQHRELIPPEREARQLYKMLESLAMLRAYGAHPLAEVLIAELTQFSRTSTAIVITASADPAWVASLQQLLYRGIRAVVVYVDQETFGGWPAQPVLTRLGELRVPVYRVAQGQPLSEALRQPIDAGATIA